MICLDKHGVKIQAPSSPRRPLYYPRRRFPERSRGIQHHGGPMRIHRFLVFVIVAFLFLIPSAAQTVSNPAQYLRQALAALNANTPTSDVTLSGSAHYIAGIDDETGTATLTAIVAASRIDLNRSSRPRREVVNTPTPPGRI